MVASVLQSLPVCAGARVALQRCDTVYPVPAPQEFPEGIRLGVSHCRAMLFTQREALLKQSKGYHSGITWFLSPPGHPHIARSWPGRQVQQSSFLASIHFLRLLAGNFVKEGSILAALDCPSWKPRVVSYWAESEVISNHCSPEIQQRPESDGLLAAAARFWPQNGCLMPDSSSLRPLFLSAAGVAPGVTWLDMSHGYCKGKVPGCVW